MLTDSARDFLTRKVSIGKEIVTYRFLSRELSIHVNEAKLLLSEFHEEAKTSSSPVHATYVVFGESSLTNHDDSEPTSASRSIFQVLLSPEAELEGTKARFNSISNIHVYSLSPSSIKNPALLVSSADAVRQKDSASRGPEHAKIIGMILNPYWNEALKGKGKAQDLPPAQSVVPKHTKGTTTEEAKPSKTEAMSTTTSIAESKPKAEEKKRAGTLDWGKAKVREPKIPSRETKGQASNKLESRGVKRDASESESERRPQPPKKRQAEQPKPAAASTSKTTPKVSSPHGPSPLPDVPKLTVKKRVLISDDEGEDDMEAPPKPSKRQKADLGKKRPAKSSRVMLMSDDEADDIPSPPQSRALNDSSPSSENESGSEPEHVPLSRSEARRKGKEPREKRVITGIDAVALQEKKEKVKAMKKSAPKGKKRVEKTRTFVNAKGMMVTEDYFSFESASEVDEPINKAEDDDGSNRSKANPRPKAKSRSNTAKRDSKQGSDGDEDKGMPQTSKSGIASGRAQEGHIVDDDGESASVEAVVKSKSKAHTAIKGVSSTGEGNSRGPSKAGASTAKPRKSGQQTLAGFFKK